MTSDADPSPNVRTPFWERLGNPLQWGEVDRVLILLAILVPALLGGLLRAIYLVDHPEVEPYIDRAVLTPIVQAAGAWIAFFALLIPIGLWIRRLKNGSRAYTHIANQSWWLLFAWFGYAVGFATSPIWVIHILLGFMCLLLFDLSIAAAGIGTSLVLIFATTVAERLGSIPYAPYFAEWPEVDGRLADAWVVSSTLWPAAVSLVTFAVFAAILRRARRQSEQLAETSDQLTRANELISRYVAVQVAEQMMTGDAGAMERTERRKLTIFFSDIRGFTETAERLEPEDLSRVLNEYFTEMGSIAQKHGGMIDKFVGDAIMVLFGAPNATSDKDHAVRAVRMATEMQERMRILQERWLDEAIEEPLEVRMGINTGVASIGNFGSVGRMDYTAIGRHVNLAARIQASCEPGRVLISHPTWILVRDEIPCEPKGELQMKGVRDPVRVYELVVPGD